MPIFFSLKGSTVLLEIMKYKMGVNVLIFAAESAHQTCSLRFLREDWGEFKMACIWKQKESIKKSIFTEFTSSEKDGPQMKIKVRKSNSATCVLVTCMLCTFPTH